MGLTAEKIISLIFKVSPNFVCDPICAVDLGFLSVTGYGQKIIEGDRADVLTITHTYTHLNFI